jgi:16S rRNA G966 N2-methylase RsmD
VILVDSDREALSLCRTNTDTLGFASRVEILAQPVERALETLGRRGERFEIIFADPPYAARVVETVLEGVARSGVLAPGGTVVIEHDKREPAPESHAGFGRVDQRRFGDTLVSLFRIP